MANLDKTTMVVTIDALERAGLAERLPSSTDRRARIIAVTAAGERMVAKAERVVAKIYDDVLSSLPDDQRKALSASADPARRGKAVDPDAVREAAAPPGGESAASSSLTNRPEQNYLVRSHL